MLRTSRRRGGRHWAALALFCTFAAVVDAAPITYTMKGVASGTIGTLNFDGASVVVTATADAGGVHMLAPGVMCNDLASASVTINGIASGKITTPVSIADNAGWQLLAIARGRCAESGLMWTNGRNTSFDRYDLASAMSMVTLDMPSAPPGVSVSTSSGELTLRNVSTLSFGAQLSALAQPQQIIEVPLAVPTLEGGTLAGLSVLLAGIGLYVLRRRRLAAPR